MEKQLVMATRQEKLIPKIINFTYEIPFTALPVPAGKLISAYLSANKKSRD